MCPPLPTSCPIHLEGPEGEGVCGSVSAAVPKNLSGPFPPPPLNTWPSRQLTEGQWVGRVSGLGNHPWNSPCQTGRPPRYWQPRECPALTPRPRPPAPTHHPPPPPAPSPPHHRPRLASPVLSAPASLIVYHLQVGDPDETFSPYLGILNSSSFF